MTTKNNTTPDSSATIDLQRYLDWYASAKTSEEARNAKACIESLIRATNPQAATTEQAGAQRAVYHDTTQTDDGTRYAFYRVKLGANEVPPDVQIVPAAATATPDWINDAVRDVAELPDRDSPADQPEMMLVSADELREIIERHAPSQATTASAEQADPHYFRMKPGGFKITPLPDNTVDAATTASASCVQDIMREVFEYARIMDGFDSLEGEERDTRRALAHAQDVKLRKMLRAALAQPEAPEWGPIRTVGDMVRNLLTLDQSDPIHAAFHVDYEGERRCRTRPVSISRERVIGGKWVDPARKDVPYAVIVWAKQDERAQPAAPAGEQK